MRQFYTDYFRQVKSGIGAIGKTVVYIVTLCGSGTAIAGNIADTILRDGDLLFQDIRCGDLCNAIETVTPAWQGKKFSHLGLVCHKGDSLMVIEAIGAAVKLTPIKTFMQRSVDSLGHPRLVLGRLKHEYAGLNAKAIAYAKKQLGVPYDNVFLYNNDHYYCSELIYDAYKEANGGKPFFQLFPMTFKDPATNDFFPVWVNYYKDLKMEIPEGKPGCNPGGIANSHKLDMVRCYY